MDEKLNKITIDFLEMLNGMNLEDIEQIKAKCKKLCKCSM